MTTQISCSKPFIGIILFLSLTANVFLGGMMAGKEMFGASAPAFQIGKLISMFQGLSEDSRAKAVAAAQKDWPAVQAALKDVRVKRDAVKELLAQKEYKQADLDKDFAAVRASVDKLMEAGQVLGSDVAKSVTPEERQKIIKMLPRPPAG